MLEKSLRFLEALVNTPSPASYESAGQKIWLSYVKPFADDTFSDAYGNTVAVLNKGGSPKVMISAHADEIALTVNYVSNEGYIYVRKLGGVNPAILQAQRVTIHTKSGPILGVVGCIPPHFISKDSQETKPPKIHELFIDIGTRSKAETLELVKIGDPITINHKFELLRNGLATARAFDNRVGTFAIAETLRLLSESKKKINAEVNIVSNIMEEVGLFGARQIAYTIKPDVAIVVDVTHSTDYPNVKKEQHGEISLGKGPTLTYGGCNHPAVVKKLEDVAEKLKIPIQHETVSSTSGTDTDAIFWTRGGIPSALVSIPNRYMHSPVEIISLHDLELVPQLLHGFCVSLKPHEKFSVII